ncbi:hypothetical protein LCGC14_0607300 [marine sediment metagenome]|uniref:Transglutaminase-like domain-containing protein n=1 Tax=marine sediment metagenome TaxID=412755 RepID=A0A0F9RDG6_9ZZZZ
MPTLIVADNQPIDARFGDSIWLTSFITPNNPDVRLKYLEITQGILATNDKIDALWRYVAEFKYKPIISSTLSTPGRKLHQEDTWFFPAEAMLLANLNCANRAFLLTSLLKNELPVPGQVYSVFGELTHNGIGNHAWVQAQIEGRLYILEATITDKARAIIPASTLDIYKGKVYFDEETVYAVEDVDVCSVINERFSVCAIPFLENYLCEKCLALEE